MKGCAMEIAWLAQADHQYIEPKKGLKLKKALPYHCLVTSYHQGRD